MPIHMYCFPSVFSCIAFYAVYLLIPQVRDQKKSSTRSLNITLNAILSLFGFSRSISLVLNQYGYRQTMSPLLLRLMWSIGFPCLTSSTSMILLVLLDTTKLSLAPPKFLKLTTILLVSGAHFVLVLLADLLVTAYLELRVLLVLCHFIYITWSLILGLGFSIVAYKMRQNLSATFQGPKIASGEYQ